MDVVFMPFTLNLSEQKSAGGSTPRRPRQGHSALLIVDTSATYYSGDDENDNVALGNHARMLRTFVDLPGGPTILVTCHPTKNPDMDEPAAARRWGIPGRGRRQPGLHQGRGHDAVEVTWHGKFRGPDFAPFSFKLMPATSAKLVDSKGRLIWSIYAQAASNAEQENA